MPNFNPHSSALQQHSKGIKKQKFSIIDLVILEYQN